MYLKWMSRQSPTYQLKKKVEEQSATWKEDEIQMLGCSSVLKICIERGPTRRGDDSNNLRESIVTRNREIKRKEGFTCKS